MIAVATDQIVFAVRDSMAPDLAEEVADRQESKAWDDLKPCPCCGRDPMPALVMADGSAKLACSNGCRIIEGSCVKDAVMIWNQPRFTD